MHYLKARRKELGLTQGQLAQLCGIGRQRICEFETGVSLPDPEQATALTKHLKIEAVLDTSQVVAGRELQRFGRVRPFESASINLEPWLTMERRWRHLLLRLKVSGKNLAWMRQFLSCDSAFEALALCLLVAAGARPMLANPHQAGFRKQPLLDRLGQALGERFLAGLRWTCPEFDVMLWPQISLQTGQGTFRPDFLLLLHRGQAVHWLGIEIDGPHHRFKDEEYRSHRLGIDLLRFTTQEVKSLDFVALLKARLKLYQAGM